MQRLGLIASAALIVGLWIPWATLSVGLFGAKPEPLGTVNGQEIGSNVLSLPVGWLVAGAGVLGLVALTRQIRGLGIAAGLVAVTVTGYAIVSIPGTETATANGQAITGTLNAQIGYAWGVWVMAAAAVLLIWAARMIDEPPIVAAHISTP